MELFGSYDVVVCGGGTSGVSAAISSARAGAKTLLIERFGVLGGQMNVSGPPGFAYAHLFNDYGEQVIGGIVAETHDRLEKEGHALPYPQPELRNGNSFAFVDPDWWGLLVFEMIREAGVHLLLHSLVVEVLKEGNGAHGVVVENTSGRQVALGKVVIDCTGEGDIAFRAGAPCEKVSKDEIEIEPPSISFTMDGVDWEKVLQYVKDNPDDFLGSKVRPKISHNEEQETRRRKQITSIKSVEDLVSLGSLGFRKITEMAIAKGEYHEFGDLGFFFTPRDGGVLQAMFQHSSQVANCDCTDIRDMTVGEIEARRQVGLALKTARKYLPGFENAYLTRITTCLRIRETRRVMGDFVLTLEHVAAATKVKDVIGKSSFGLGSHHVATIDSRRPGVKGRQSPKDGGSYDIPYRCLVPRNIENFMVAGKMISAEREAYLRFLPETMVTGQAAGVAAAICAQKDITPRQLEKDVSELQKILLQQGVILYGTH
ncbi:MAG: FAD-dependent oxidoreductase [Thermodesulfobacteriota bacterium]